MCVFVRACIVLSNQGEENCRSEGSVSEENG